MKLTDFMNPKAFIPDLQAHGRDDAIAELVGALARVGAIAEDVAENIAQAIIHREEQGSTGIGKGIAVPHIKHPAVKSIVGAIGGSRKGIDFASLDKAPVYSVLLLISPPDQPDQHLEAMECLFAHLQQDMFRKFLRQAEDADAIWDLLKEADEGGNPGGL